MADSTALCSPRLIAVGSQNPVKIAATQAVFTRLCGSARVEALAVASGVSAQPWGDAETRRGALNRARAARERLGAEWGVGFEGGLLEVEGDLYVSAWCAAIGPEGRVGTAGGENLLLPPPVVAELRRGVELGTAIDHLLGTQGSKREGGAIAALTGGRLTRAQVYENLLLMALAPFLTPAFYEVRR